MLITKMWRKDREKKCSIITEIEHCFGIRTYRSKKRIWLVRKAVTKKEEY